MTISSNVRTAGPYTGNDTATEFSFEFKVFDAGEVVVIQTDADGAETTLVEGTDYTVDLNSDQDTSPGGSVTLDAALPTGEKLTVTSDVDYLQSLDLTNQGGFYPQTINDALDRLTILAQQTAEEASRAFKVKISSDDDPDQLVADLFAAEVDAENAASNAASSASNAADSETAAASSASAAASSASAASTSASNAADSETAAASSADAAASSASAASTSASNASDSADAAASSASAAADSESNAAASATSASDHLQTFRGTYYGDLSSDPGTDPNGDPVDKGDFYFNTTLNTPRFYNGESWGSNDVPAHAAETQTHGAPSGGRLVHTGDVGNYETKAIGEPFALWDHITGVPEPDNSGSAKFIKLTAGLTGAGEYNEGLLTAESVIGSAPLVEATAEIATGPLSGEVVHLMNTEESVIRARETSGILQFDQMQRITGTLGIRPDRFQTPEGTGVFSDSVNDGSRDHTGTGTGYQWIIDMDSANSPDARASSTTDGETRAKNVSATFYMRIV